MLSLQVQVDRRCCSLFLCLSREVRFNRLNAGHNASKTRARLTASRSVSAARAQLALPEGIIFLVMMLSGMETAPARDNRQRQPWRR